MTQAAFRKEKLDFAMLSKSASRRFLLCVLVTLSAAPSFNARREAGFVNGSDAFYTVRKERLRLFDELTDARVYDKRIRPAGGDATTTADGPVTVNVSLHVSVIGGLDSQTTEFTALTVFELRWTDGRLRYANRTELAPIDVDEWGRDRIWVPSLAASNDKQSTKIAVPKENAFVSVSPTGAVTYRYRTMLRVYCAANVAEFPFDEHTCRIYLENWGLRDIDVVLQWSTSGGGELENEAGCGFGQVTVDGEFKPMEYTLKSATPSSCASSTRPAPVAHKDGGTSALYVTFVLRREWAHYAIDFYTPAVLLVALSWVSFWLDPSQIAARVTLGSNAMLSFITLSRTLSSAIPKVAYVNAMDVYSMVCLGFIFGSLVELALVNGIWRRKYGVRAEKLSARCVLLGVLGSDAGRRRRDSSCRTQANGPLHQSDGLAMKPALLSDGSPELVRGTSFTQPGDSEVCLGNETKHRADVKVPGSRGVGQNDSKQTDFTRSTPVAGDKTTVFLPHEMAKWIDEQSRFAFPVAFVAANALYWSLIWA